MLIDGNTLQGKTHLMGAPRQYKTKLAPGIRYKDFIEIAIKLENALQIQFVRPYHKFRCEYFYGKKMVVVPTREKTPLNHREVKLIKEDAA